MRLTLASPMLIVVPMSSTHFQARSAQSSSPKASLPASKATPARLVGMIILVLLALMPSDSQAEVNTGHAITSLPYVITNSGHYYLPHNFNNFSLSTNAVLRGITYAIRILVNDSTNDVVLDLNNRTITAVSTNGFPIGIIVLHDARPSGT